MKISWSKALKTGLFLAVVASVAAVGLSALNLLTAPIIAQGKANKEAEGLKKVFGSAATYEEAVAINDNQYTCLTKYWPVTLANGEASRIYSASGQNSYGTVSLLVGIYDDYSLGPVHLLENTQSFASDLVDNYVEPYQKAEDKEEAINNVRCGATSGAKLIRTLILTAKAHYQGGQS